MPERFLPVSLVPHANAVLGAGLDAELTVQGIPLRVPRTATADHLYLAEAGWPECQDDPSAFYAGYDQAPEGIDPRRPFFTIPVADYACVYLLARAEPDPALSATVTLRIGRFDGRRRVRLHDVAVSVPRADAAVGDQVVAVIPSKAGPLFLLKVPLCLAIAQDFAEVDALHVEVTKELRLAIRRPDPCRFQYRPLGLPSGVRLFAMTFVRSPVQMRVEPRRTGWVFEEPEVPGCRIELTVDDGALAGCRLEAVITPFGGEPTVVATHAVTAGALELALPVSARGYHALSLRLSRDGEELLRRETHLALLAPDTRTHRESAPWGTWDFSGTHFTPDTAAAVGPLYWRAGLRYGMFHFPEAERQRYGVTQGNDPTVKNAKMVHELAEKLAAAGAPPPARVMIFHEDAISGPHLMRVPGCFTGQGPYTMDAAEQERFDMLWQGATEAATEVRRLFPKAEIYFGNGNLHLLDEFLQRGFPRELFDARGNEAASFQRLPESQPPDFVANNAGLWMDRQVLDHRGYADKSLRQCYEICYPSTNPGNLTLAGQAAHLVRHILHSMVWEIPIVRFSSITDMANSYYYSNWGASGLCFARPDVAPKPSYVAVAVLTRLLDGAAFRRVVPASPSVYAVEFARPDGGCVTCLWTPRGRREVTVCVDGESTLVDPMGNERPLAAGGRNLVIAEAPVYLLSAAPIRELAAPPSVIALGPPAEAVRLDSLASLAAWEVEAGRDVELETAEFVCPRRLGDFRFRAVDEVAGVRDVLEVSPGPVPGSVYLPMYAVLRHRTGVEIAGEPTGIGLMVNGNGGWGRLIFELEDAAGQRWISLGCAQRGKPTAWMADWLPADRLAVPEGYQPGDWNTSDAWGRSVVCFEGWRYLSMPLPGNYPGERYHWPYSSQWRYDGDGIVHYPLTFRRLAIALPEKVLKFRDYAPVPRASIYLHDLSVTYEP